MRGGQPDALFRIAGAPGTRLLLATGEIFTQLQGRTLAPTLFGVRERTFSTIGKPGCLALSGIGFALVFRVVRHGRVITDRRKIEKSPPLLA